MCDAGSTVVSFRGRALAACGLAERRRGWDPVCGIRRRHCMQGAARSCDCASVPCPGRATLQAARKSCRRAPFGVLACLRGNERFVVHGGPSGGQLPEAVAVVFVVAVATPAPQSARCRVPTPETVRGLAPASRRGHNPRPAAQREADPARGEIHAPDVADRCRHATRRLLSCNPIHSACPEHPPNPVPRSC